MIILLSPAKTQDFETNTSNRAHSQPRFQAEISQLVAEIKQLTPLQIADLMSISDKLADLNHGRYQNFAPKFTQKNAKQALLTFKGDVYRPMDAENYSKSDLEFAQKHLRMLSGLYGLLRPLDLMQPYRLEMKIPLKNALGSDLYAFWGSKITEQINADLAKQGDDIVINCASNEYFKAVQPKDINGRIITPVFMDQKPGQKPKIIALFAKKARGMMADFIIKNRLEDPEALKRFSEGGYKHDKSLSNGDKWVFLR